MRDISSFIYKADTSVGSPTSSDERRDKLNKKKILFVITKANWGGAQRYVYDLATHLPKDEFAVAVVFGERGRLRDELEKVGIETFEVKSLRRDVSLIKDIRSFFVLLRLFRRLKPDVVHLNSSKAAGLGSVAARLAGVPKIIFTAHGWPFWENRSLVARGVIWIFSWLTSIFSHHVITVSDYDLRVAQNYMPLLGNKAVRIYNGIDLDMQFDSGEKIRSAFPPSAIITGTIGELNKNKNQKVLIEEARDKPDMYVAIVGEGEERAVLEQKIEEYGLTGRVKLFGFMPGAEAMKGFDRFALPSLKEGLPYVLLEARCAHLPIDANRVGGVGEILDAKDMTEFSLKHMLEKTLTLYLPAGSQVGN